MGKYVKKMLIFLFILLLFCISACQKKTPYFKDIHLGMSRDEIIELKKDWGTPQISEQDYVLYENVKYNNLSGETDFTFDANSKLVQSNIIIVPKENKSSDVYDQLVKDLSTEYGEAAGLYENATMWKIELSGTESYILALHDSINKNLSIILCTPEIYDEIINFNQIAEPTK